MAGGEHVGDLALDRREAPDGGHGLRGVLRGGADAEGGAPHDRRARPVGEDPGHARPRDVVEHGLVEVTVRHRLPGGVVRVGPVDHEGAVVGLEPGAGTLLVAAGQVPVGGPVRDLAECSGRRLAGAGVEGRGGVAAGLGVRQDLPAGGGDQGGDEQREALVGAADDRHGGARVLGGPDHLVPRDRRPGRVEAGPLRHRAPVPEQLRVGPERGGDGPTVPRRRLAGAAEDAVGHVAGLAVGEGPEQPGGRELRDEGRVEAHDVRRGVLVGQALLRLAVLGVAREGQRPHGDRVVVGLVVAPRRQRRLPAVVGVHVPGQGRGLVVADQAGHAERHARGDEGDGEDERHVAQHRPPRPASAARRRPTSNVAHRARSFTAS
jgi:hypothetical protein